MQLLCCLLAVQTLSLQQSTDLGNAQLIPRVHARGKANRKSSWQAAQSLYPAQTQRLDCLFTHLSWTNKKDFFFPFTFKYIDSCQSVERTSTNKVQLDRIRCNAFKLLELRSTLCDTVQHWLDTMQCMPHRSLVSPVPENVMLSHEIETLLERGQVRRFGYPPLASRAGNHLWDNTTLVWLKALLWCMTCVRFPSSDL